MKQRIVAISLALAAALAGTYTVFNWETATVERVFDRDWDFVDKDSCAISACNSAACITAQNHIDDAGFPCNVRLASCNTRINARLRAAAAANGVTLGPSRYQRLRVGVEICTLDGGGKSFGLALDDAGWPMLGTVVAQTPPCVRAPVDGGLNCRRDELDGGSRFYGAGNVFPASLAVGTQCDAVECGVIYGDDPDVDL